MTKPLTKEEKDRRATERKDQGGTATAPRKGGGKHASNGHVAQVTLATGPVEAVPEEAGQEGRELPATAEVAAPASIVTANLPEVEPQAVIVTEPTEVVATTTATAPSKTKLTTEQTLDLGLNKIARDQIRDLAELDRIGQEKEQLREVITSLGLEVPDEPNQPQARGRRTRVAKNVNGSKTATPTAKANGGTGLWEIIREHLAKKGCVDPKTCPSTEIMELAEQHQYSTAANMLSQRTKGGFLVKPGRGIYCLPKNWKTQV